MKNLLLTATVLYIFFSCKKDDGVSTKIDTAAEKNYVENITKNLKDSLSKEDYEAIDFRRLFKGKNPVNNRLILRIGLVGKKMAGDFIIAETDSTGNILNGRIVHFSETQNLRVSGKVNSTGKFVVSSFNRKLLNNLQIQNGKITKPNRSALKVEDEPVGMQVLQDVVVTAYLNNGITSTQYYNIGYFFDMNYAGDGVYGLSEPTGGGGDQDDQLFIIHTESTSYNPINLRRYIDCFSSIPDNGSVCKMTIFSDLPVNGDPTKLFNSETASVGHSFIQLNKTGNGQIIQQNIGFYPATGWKSIEASDPVTSKFVDNAGHKYNASYTIIVDPAHFQLALDDILRLSNMKYDIDDWNCTDFAVDVFNQASSEYLEIPKYHLPGSMDGQESSTPEGLYVAIQNLIRAGNTPGSLEIPGVCGFVGNSHGPCN